ncbi:trigger factor [Paenibacillus wulumuqiensis]|uniref:hypothetical protein n=1 Tax=Paenibacillus wulumuqiensis TaxID=1567107 RepID=UPI000619E7EF|nr:hypothetical protein [Paenibacillus wulumuqiensis]
MQTIKSHVVSEFDYKKIPVDPSRLICETSLALHTELERIRRKYRVQVKTEQAALQDMITCNLESQHERFNQQNLSLTIGLGLFHRELEQRLIGVPVGKKIDLTVDGHRVTAELTQILHNVIPELDDDIVAREGIRGISTTRAFERHVYREVAEPIIDEKLYPVITEVIAGVIEQSEFSIDPQDVRALSEIELQRTRMIAKKEGFVLEDMTPEQFDGRIPVHTFEELQSLVYEETEKSFPAFLLGVKHMEQDGVTVSRDKYEKAVAEYSTNYNYTIEEAREVMAFELFESWEIQDYYYNKVSQHLKKHIQEV